DCCLRPSCQNVFAANRRIKPLASEEGTDNHFKYTTTTQATRIAAEIPASVVHSGAPAYCCAPSANSSALAPSMHALMGSPHPPVPSQYSAARGSAHSDSAPHAAAHHSR